ncbi:MAG TPA: peptidoglycan DD-metalloendopeptidase family protein [Feifaniaceae bacterium]|nr:peptidoglycan DD-metalloendopeptidase family protein [Feifaniaceae bacterium]
MEHKGTRGAFRENASAFLKKQGFYVVMGLCVLCIGIAAAVALLPDAEAQQPESTPLSQAAGANQDEPLSEAARPTAAPTPAVTPEPSPSSAPTPTPKPRRQAESKLAPPVDGEVIWGFAVDTLLYSETLEIWTTHDGVDIKARLGTDVIAVKSGTVEKVYDDKKLGISVLVEHEDGLKSLYANLANPAAVKEGQRVNAGEKLGAVGDTAVSECAMDPHLHFALYRDGQAADPSKYVLLGD